MLQRPMTTPLYAPQPGGPSFSDARLGALQLRTMGLRAFGGFSEKFVESQKRNAEKSAGAAAAAAATSADDNAPPPAASMVRLADGQLVPRPPPSVLPRTSQPSGLVLSERPWEHPVDPLTLSPRSKAGIGGGGSGAGGGLMNRSGAAADRLPPWDIGTRPASPASRPASPRTSSASPRRQAREKPPRSYAQPSTRAEVERLGAALNRKLDAINAQASSARTSSSSGGSGGHHERKDEEWHATFVELVRQVYVHCAERGQLLDSVRVHYESKLKEFRMRMQEQGRELAAMRKQAALLGIDSGGGGGSVVAGGAAGGAGGSGNGCGGGGGSDKKGGAKDARQEAMEWQRMEALAVSASSLPVDKRASLMARLAEGAGEGAEGAQQLLKDGLGAASLKDMMAVLAHSLGTLRVTDLLEVLEDVCRGLNPTNRQKLVTMLVEQLEETERSKQAIAISKTLPSRAVGDVAKHLLQGMTKIARQPAVNSLLKGLTRDERITMTADVLASVSLGDVVQVVQLQSSQMAPNDRGALVSGVLDTVSDAERVDLVQEQLVAMDEDVRANMLSSVFGLLTNSQRRDLMSRLQGPSLGIDD